MLLGPSTVNSCEPQQPGVEQPCPKALILTSAETWGTLGAKRVGLGWKLNNHKDLGAGFCLWITPSGLHSRATP